MNSAEYAEPSLEFTLLSGTESPFIKKYRRIIYLGAMDNIPSLDSYYKTPTIKSKNNKNTNQVKNLGKDISDEKLFPVLLKWHTNSGDERFAEVNKAE